MAPDGFVHATIKPWNYEEPEENEDDYGEDVDDGQNSEVHSKSASDQDQDESESEESTPEPPHENEASLEDISFGALAKAQASIAPSSRKRKLAEIEDATRYTRETYHPVYDDETKREANKAKHATLSRTSKHAPTMLSSRYAVPRKRDIFDPSPALKSRDPRFDVTVTTSTRNTTAIDKANKHYSFLSSYQAAEILDLKAQIKKAKDPEVVAELKRQVMSIESKVRWAEAKQRENEILKKHKQKEREAIQTGQKAKPYFLKRSELKKEALVEKFNSMGKRARDKAMDRKRKRTKGKESKGMPRVRREVGVS